MRSTDEGAVQPESEIYQSPLELGTVARIINVSNLVKDSPSPGWSLNEDGSRSRAVFTLDVTIQTIDNGDSHRFGTNVIEENIGQRNRRFIVKMNVGKATHDKIETGLTDSVLNDAVVKTANFEAIIGDRHRSVVDKVIDRSRCHCGNG